MKEIKENKEKKKVSKGERLFQLVLGAISCLVVFCCVGCGGSPDTCVRCDCVSLETSDNLSAKQLSLPGLGGLTCAKTGCGSCVWAQSCKCVCVDTDDTQYTKGGCINACDIIYLEDGNEQSCSTGCANTEEGKGCYRENDEGNGCLFGCTGGCFGCSKTKNSFYGNTLSRAEWELENQK